VTWRPARPDEDPPRPIEASLNQVVRGLGRSAPLLVGLTGRWAEVVGPTLAAHTRPVRMDGEVLVVAVDEPAWATEVRYLAPELARRAEALVGAGRVRSVRVVVRAG